MRPLSAIPELVNTPVLVRAALNVPVENGEVINDYRLRKAVPTLRYLAEHSARVIVISHIGEKGTETLEPVARALGKRMPGVSFFGETIGERARSAVRALLPGEILVLENLRRNRGEKMNDRDFAKELAALADVFVQDSFDTCHRPHASIIGVPELLPSYAGLQLEEEVRELSQARAPQAPSLAIIGGAKFSTKEDVLDALLTMYDRVFVGGALATDFLKAAGQGVGKSLVSDADPKHIDALLDNPRLLLPIDSIVVPADKAAAQDAKAYARVAPAGSIRPDEVILDHGPDTSALLARFAADAKTILWNGPLGNYENGFTDATYAFARDAAHARAHSVIGGGDTVATIDALGLLPRFSFVSTGGGAMLDFLVKGTLPGITALDESRFQ